ncbi:MAG: hypothetical protein ABIQ04_04565 [Candidatus Saccharimonadales bacterium]
MQDNIFHVKPWSPDVIKVAEGLIHKIHQFTPGLKVLFMGSAALGLPGKNDIDLDVLCKWKDLVMYTEKLSVVLGAPKEIHKNLVAWEYMLDGFEIDVILSDPLFSHVPEQQKTFETLRDSPHLLTEYRLLKESCDGLPYKEYEKRKKDFLNSSVYTDSHS